MNCPLCGSVLKEAAVTVKRVVNGKDVYFINVPGEVCSNDLCGQIILHGSIVKEMKKIINKAREDKIDLNKTFDFSRSEDFYNNLEQYAGTTN
ncbi:YgiT-type zinc finger protein [Aneurinibacillus sp. Ricciae_BoGa-3]|uniref:YgiT-type zinc finger protein n=1 Tax=Aneurinibacillus sp. Ricciae_BoGa-3 TaxID=3022697 RepID=UPI002341F3F6|nr:YgiT-type zinc finger protein [Aneurinibacillus sp. Ricciae_BoGa-3]WCK52761.1 YgiT-type zinc finger protein [Aneurinibacillus sp. Ricciae_BoGa-3]